MRNAGRADREKRKYGRVELLQSSFLSVYLNIEF